MNLTPLLDIARQGIPFTAADGQAFVHLPVPSSGGFYILPVRSPAFRDWFFYRFFNQHETLPTAHAFHALLNHLEAQASQNEDYQRLAVFRRVGARGPAPFYNQILLDLDDSDRRFVEISLTPGELPPAPTRAANVAGRVSIDSNGGQVRATGPESVDNNHSWWSVTYEIFVLRIRT
jgi:hypothetical protein